LIQNILHFCVSFYVASFIKHQKNIKNHFSS
jgi:hypothetical protein